MSKTSYVSVSLAAVLIAAPLLAGDAKPKTESASVTVKTTIEAIDHAARTVTLKGKDGNYETLSAGPEIKRFDELKVGDTITFRYVESVLAAIQKPGQAPKAKASDEPKITRGTGARPSGMITQQQKATVTIKAIDPKVPSVTVTTEDGHTQSFKVEDKKMLGDFKAGDKVEITYTEALMISVK
jgi:Cu/Ag efflux protein CusF